MDILDHGTGYLKNFWSEFSEDFERSTFMKASGEDDMKGASTKVWKY